LDSGRVGRAAGFGLKAPGRQLAGGLESGPPKSREMPRLLTERKPSSAREETTIQPLVHLAPQTVTESVPAALTVADKALSSGQARPVNPTDLLEAEMKRNGLLPNPSHYEYTLRAKSFVVNGTVQPAEVAYKYRRLYEAASGKKMWPLISSLYRHIHDDDAPATGSAGSSTP
jgi:hypothetical protein